MPIASSAYGQQVSLAMQGGEQLDLFHTGSGLELSTWKHLVGSAVATEKKSLK